MNIGIMTSGGDGPGLNAVIRGAVRKGIRAHGFSFTGIRDGWRGLLEDDTHPLHMVDVRGLSGRGGTILGTSRTHPYSQGGPDQMRTVMERRGIDVELLRERLRWLREKQDVAETSMPSVSHLIVIRVRARSAC